MSQTKFVEYRDQGFWAYDVALGIFLKHLIDDGQARAAANGDAWLAEAVSDWRIIAGVSDYGLAIDDEWSAAQIDVFVDLADEACRSLMRRESFSAEEIEAWPIVDDVRLHPRGATDVSTAPVVELGRAIIALVNGSLPAAPAGTLWFYGTPEGRRTIACAVDGWDVPPP